MGKRGLDDLDISLSIAYAPVGSWVPLLRLVHMKLWLCTIIDPGPAHLLMT